MDDNQIQRFMEVSSDNVKATLAAYKALIDRLLLLEEQINRIERAIKPKGVE